MPEKKLLEFDWLEEYCNGKSFEIYKTTLSSHFEGKKFSEAAAQIYKKFNAILFAIEIDNGDNVKIYSNPGRFKLPACHKN